MGYKPNNTESLYIGGSAYTLLLLVAIAPNLGKRTSIEVMFWKLTDSDKQGHTVDGNQKSCDHILSSVVEIPLFTVLLKLHPNRGLLAG